MLEFTGNCAIKLYTYVTNIPVRIAEKRMQEETRQRELLNKKGQMIYGVLKEIAKSKEAQEALYFEQAKQRLADKEKGDIARFKTQREFLSKVTPIGNPELMELARCYAHCKMDDETSLQFRGESYLFKPLLNGVIIRID